MSVKSDYLSLTWPYSFCTYRNFKKKSFFDEFLSFPCCTDQKISNFLFSFLFNLVFTIELYLTVESRVSSFNHVLLVYNGLPGESFLDKNLRD